MNNRPFEIGERVKHNENHLYWEIISFVDESRVYCRAADQYQLAPTIFAVSDLSHVQFPSTPDGSMLCVL